MDKIFLRTYTKPKNEKKKQKLEYEGYKEHRAVFVFDTETTTDIRQDLRVGFFQLYVNGNLIQEGLFYKNLPREEKNILFDYGRKNKIEIYSLSQFIHQIFFPIVLKLKVLCIGFNLPFDISRIASTFSPARRNEKEGFSFALCNNSAYPRIKIKQLHFYQL